MPDGHALRLLAIQLAVQLPAERESAALVVEMLSELVEAWLYEACFRPLATTGEGGAGGLSNVITFAVKPESSPR